MLRIEGFFGYMSNRPGLQRRGWSIAFATLIGVFCLIIAAYA